MPEYEKRPYKIGPSHAFIEPDGDIFYDTFKRPATRHTHGYNGIASVEIQYNGFCDPNEPDEIMARMEIAISDLTEETPLPTSN